MKAGCSLFKQYDTASGVSKVCVLTTSSACHHLLNEAEFALR